MIESSVPVSVGVVGDGDVMEGVAAVVPSSSLWTMAEAVCDLMGPSLSEEGVAPGEVWARRGLFVGVWSASGLVRFVVGVLG